VALRLHEAKGGIWEESGGKRRRLLPRSIAAWRLKYLLIAIYAAWAVTEEESSNRRRGLAGGVSSL